LNLAEPPNWWAGAVPKGICNSACNAGRSAGSRSASPLWDERQTGRAPHSLFPAIRTRDPSDQAHV